MGRRIAGIAPLALVVFGAALLVGGGWPYAPRDSGDAVARTISASTSVFIPTILSVPERSRVTLTFRNSSSEPHTLILLEPIGVETAGVVLAQTSQTLAFTSPRRGDYVFVCNVHEGMAGTLRVE
jgi:plastocyanin